MKNRNLGFLIVFIFLFAAKSWAATITVTSGSTDELSSTPDGSCSLSEAVTNANNNASTYGDCVGGESSSVDHIIIPAGSYIAKKIPTITGSVKITGAGNDSATGTIIDSGDLNSIFRVTKDDIILTLEKLQTKGSARTGFVDFVGNGNLIISELTITGGNYGVLFTGSNFTLTDSMITENGYGGIQVSEGNANISNSYVTGNGQGIIVYGGVKLSLSDSTVKDNNYEGIVNIGANVTLDRSYVIDNGGSGILLGLSATSSSELSITDSHVSGNIKMGIYVYLDAEFVLGEEPSSDIPKITIQSSTITGNLDGLGFGAGGIFLELEIYSDYTNSDDIDFNNYLGAIVLADKLVSDGSSIISDNESSNCGISITYYGDDTEIKNFDLSLTEENSELTFTSDCIFVLDSSSGATGGEGTATSGGSATGGATTGTGSGGGTTTSGGSTTSGSETTSGGGTAGGTDEGNPAVGEGEGGGGCSLIVE